jgi:hypothetical protein
VTAYEGRAAATPHAAASGTTRTAAARAPRQRATGQVSASRIATTRTAKRARICACSSCRTIACFHATKIGTSRAISALRLRGLGCFTTQRETRRNQNTKHAGSIHPGSASKLIPEE